MNLLCAEGLRGSEKLNVADCLEKLDGMAKYVKSETDRHQYKFKEHPDEFNHSEGYYRMMMMVTVLQQDLKVHYNPERVLLPTKPIEPNEKFFASSQDVFIHGLVRERGMGTCSSMPVFLVAVGRRLGYPLKLVKAKGHLFVRWDDGERSFNIEATSIGFVSHPDAFYWNWPVPFTPEEAQAEGYLKHLSPAQELSVFLSTRGLCLQAAGNHKLALGAFDYARKRDPQSVGNRLLLERAEILALQAGVLPIRQAVYVASKHLDIPEGQWREYLTQQKMLLQSAIVLGGTPDGEIEGRFQILKREIENVRAGLPPGQVGNATPTDIPVR